MFTKIAVVAIALGVLMSVAASLLNSTEPAPPSHFFTDRDGVALGGHDPVAYFTQDEAVPGKLSIATRHQGATFRFADKHHRRAFLIDPATYVPEFAGAGAWAVSEGALAVGDPRTFEVFDGRLYLFVNEAARQRFREGPAERVAAARRNWPKVLARWAGEDEPSTRGPPSPSSDAPATPATVGGGGWPQPADDTLSGWIEAGGRR